MLTRGRTVLLALACLAGVLLVGWAAASGPVGGSVGTGPAPSYVASSPSTPLRSPSPTATPTTKHQRVHIAHGPDLSWIRYVALGLVLVALGLVLIAALRPLARLALRLVRMWRELPDNDQDPHRPVPAGLLPGEDELAQAMVADRERQLSTVDQGSPRNGIVAAWRRLEEITAESGLPREGWETSAEFTVRMLKGLDVDPGAAGELAGLYRQARFSSHDVDQAERDRARAALARLHDDVRQLR